MFSDVSSHIVHEPSSKESNGPAATLFAADCDPEQIHARHWRRHRRSGESVFGESPPSLHISHLAWQLDEEFRYLYRKKNVVKELSEVRRKVSTNSLIYQILPSQLVEHDILRQPHEIPRGPCSCHLAHLQSVPG